MVNLRLLHLTDLHLTDGPRLVDQAAVLEHIVRTAIAIGVQATLVTGDLYGMTVPHRSTPAERAVLYPAIRTLAKIGPVVVVYGNHDYPGDLETLAQIGGGFGWPVHVAAAAKRLRLHTTGPDLDVYALPWVTKRWLLAGVEAPRGVEATRQLAGEKVGLLLRLWAARRARSAAVSVFASHCMIAGSTTSGGERLHGTDIEVPCAGLVALSPDVGLLGHIHTRQQPAPRCWYGGDPYAVDFGETDTKGVQIIDIADTAADLPPVPPDALDERLEPDNGRTVRVVYLRTPARRFVTLDWRWAADLDDGSPRWVDRPTPDEIAAVRDCEVRARLVVPAQWRAGCPWGAELHALRAAGAHCIQVEAITEPVLRVRAPALAKAETPLDKLRAYWGTLATTPDEPDQASAVSLLGDLSTSTDEDIRADTDRLIEGI